MTPCATHASYPAGWRCTECGAALCPDCAVRKVSGTTQVEACGHCGALATPLLVPREAGPWSSLLEGIVTYPVAGDGWRVFVAAVVVLGTLRLMWLPGTALANAILAAYLFHVVRESGKGRDEAPEFGDFTSAFDFTAASFKFGACVLLGLVPAWLYLTFTGRAFEPASFKDPVTWLLLLLGLGWTPAAIVYAAVDSPMGVVLNPAHAWTAARRIGADYVKTAAVFWALFAVRSGLESGVEKLIPVPIVPGLLTMAPGLYLQVIGARVLGLLLYVHGGRLGYGRLDDYFEPALGKTRPKRVVAVKPAVHVGSTSAAVHVEPIELTDAPVAPQAFQAWQPTDSENVIDLPEAPVVRAEVPETPKKPVPAEDLVSEEEFLAGLYAEKK